MFRTQRLRDPVHGLIVFREGEGVDELAWNLINTPEFQRLRRIKQLGVSEHVFPGATHTRFAHCIGVFHTARSLLEVIRREQKAAGRRFDEKRAHVALIAALLHDVGHGPFSHTFEGVRKAQGIKKRHEEWTAEIITNKRGRIRKLLHSYWKRGAFTKVVAELLASDDPKDIYHAIVSSSFDADRLDYLRRDRMMTGSGAGAIDFDWLMEHVRVASVNLSVAESESDGNGRATGATPLVPTFCIDVKAQPAAEQFLLARYALHEQVYFHKTTRCIERMISELLRRVAEQAKKTASAPKKTGLRKGHPLFKFFSTTNPPVEAYLALDDALVLGSLETMINAKDSEIAALAGRLLYRDLYKTLDIRSFGSDEGLQTLRARQIDRMMSGDKFSGIVLKDEGASLSIYSQVGGDEEKAHKKLRILDANGKTFEISSRSKIIEELSQKKRQFTRYYFEKESDRTKARKLH